MKADLYIHNARIWTGDPHRPRATSLLVRGGRISALDAPPPADCDRVIDAGGRTIAPGFIDAHMHLIMGGLTLSDLDLRDVRSPDEFMQRIAQRHEQLPPGQWLIARNWSAENWTRGINSRLTPHASSLQRDASSPHKSWLAPAGNRPVVCYRMDLHAALVNDAVLSLCDLSASPSDGRIERDPATSEPTGMMIEAALWKLVNPLIPEPDVRAKTEALLRAQAHCHALGITSVNTMEYSREARDIMLPLADRLTLRCAVTLLDRSWPMDFDEANDLRSKAHHNVSIIGCKAFADGTLGSRSAKLLEDYADDPGNSGMFVEIAAQGHLSDWASAVAEAGFSPFIHAIGDEAVRLALHAVENLPKNTIARIEHAQQIDPEDIARFGLPGVVASMQPLHKADDGRYAHRRLGEARMIGFFPFRQLLNAGARIAFGSDWPVVSCDPIAGMRAAITGLTIDNEPVRTEENLTVEEALRAYTYAAARALQLDSETGTLAEGQSADFLILDTDPFETDWVNHPPRIDATIAAGQVVHAARQL